VKKKQNGNMQLSQSKVRQIQTLSDIKILSWYSMSWNEMKWNEMKCIYKLYLCLI
jgi:hypothetical protein